MYVCIYIYFFSGFPEMVVPQQLDGLSWKIRWTWNIQGYPDFRTAPFIYSQWGLNMFAPTRTLLHTYNRHDDDAADDDDDDHHHHHCHHNHHHHHIIITSWSSSHLNSQPPLNNLLTGVITSTLYSRGVKIRHPSEQYVAWGNNINFIFMRDQHSPAPMNNMLIGVITSTLSSQWIKIRHPQ